jgi:hypothetical protein
MLFLAKLPIHSIHAVTADSIIDGLSQAEIVADFTGSHQKRVQRISFFCDASLDSFVFKSNTKELALLAKSNSLLGASGINSTWIGSGAVNSIGLALSHVKKFHIVCSQLAINSL